ncbi:MAG: biotin transporter BioY [Ignavibacteria bacterium]|nr:biotin transporter BioY [Ignavibacteria bacterium]
MHTVTLDSAISLSNSKTLSNALWIGGFSLLTAVGAQIVIPTVPVPFTLQTLFVLLSGAMLGARKGAAAQIAYLMLGASGLPVFAGFSGSVLRLVGPTGGYLLAFPIAAFLTGYLIHDVRIMQALPRFATALIAMTAAMAVIFALGIAQLNVTIFHNLGASVAAGFTQLQAWDAVKILAAAGIASETGRRFTR